MTKIRLTKEFRFEMAHALYNYDGLCKNIHGHSYILQVTVLGVPEQDPASPKLGMVMDFGDLKAIVNREIVNELDHAIVVSNKVAPELIASLGQMGERHFILDYQPTCENMLIDLLSVCKRLFLPKWNSSALSCTKRRILLPSGTPAITDVK